MRIEHNVRADFQRPGVRPVIRVAEGDAGTRFIVVDLYNGGQPYSVGTGVTGVVKYAKTDGHSGVYDTLDEGEATERAAVVFHDNSRQAVVELATNICKGFGLVAVIVQFVKDTEILTTFPLDVIVERDPTDGTTAEDFFSLRALDNLYKQLDDVEERAKDITELVEGFNLIDASQNMEGMVYRATGVFNALAGYVSSIKIPVDNAKGTRVRCNVKAVRLVAYDSTAAGHTDATGYLRRQDNGYAIDITGAVYIGISWLATDDLSHLMLAYTNETSGATTDKWDQLFPGIGYIPYDTRYQVPQDAVVGLGEIKSAVDALTDARNDTENRRISPARLVAECVAKGASVEEGQHGDTVTLTNAQNSLRVYGRCQPGRAYVLDFWGQTTNPDSGGYFVLDFLDETQSSLIGGQPHMAILGESDLRYHRYGSVAPLGAAYWRLWLHVPTGVTCKVAGFNLSPVEQMPQRSSGGIKIDGHLGMLYSAPRNTMPALEMAKIAGHSLCIINVKTTADGILVCLHDTTIDATSDGTGDVSAYTYEQLLDYNFGAKFQGGTYVTQIPRFEDAVQYLASCGITPAVSLHTSNTAGEAAAVARILSRYSTRPLIKAFSASLLTAAYNAIGDRAEYMLCTSAPTAALVDTVEAFPGECWLEIESGHLDEAVISYAHDHGVRLSMYYGNTFGVVRRAIKLGIMRYCTDVFSDITIPAD